MIHFKTNQNYLDILEKVKEKKEGWNKIYRYKKNGVSIGKIIAQTVRKFADENLFKDGNFDIRKFCEYIGVQVKENINFVFNEDEKKTIKFLYNGDKTNIWGMLSKVESVIYLSHFLETEKAKRFTIAHEIGHLFIDDDSKSGQDVFFRNRTQIGGEVFINDFAGNFLVGNLEKLKKDAKTKSANTLSKIYQVPFETIGILLDEIEKEDQKMRRKISD